MFLLYNFLGFWGKMTVFHISLAPHQAVGLNQPGLKPQKRPLHKCWGAIRMLVQVFRNRGKNLPQVGENRQVV